jgi:glucoamylase
MLRLTLALSLVATLFAGGCTMVRAAPDAGTADAGGTKDPVDAGVPTPGSATQHHNQGNPYIDGTAKEDAAYVSSDGLFARNTAANKYLAVRLSSNAASIVPASFVQTSAGFVGPSDGLCDIRGPGPDLPDCTVSGNTPQVMDWFYDWADDGGGNVAMIAQLPTIDSGQTLDFNLAVGFGSSHGEAIASADGSLAAGYQAVLDKYNGSGSDIGWEDYLSNLSNLPAMLPSTGDGGAQLYASALVLKALEDKENAGALIASLSTPWGETVSAQDLQTGYRAVWPRDFYQAAMALLALGDTETPKAAFEFLPQVQVRSTVIDRDGVRIETTRSGWNTSKPGWFLQKTHVDGTLEWIQVQMDQTAMPIMLGWQLWQRGVLTDTEITDWYWDMLKPAAEFLANGGHVHLTFPDGGTDEYTVVPPWTKQERWEEASGYSPSTNAAVITGLVAAADIGRLVGGSEIGAAVYYERKADTFVAQLKATMFAETGLGGTVGDGQYFIRINDDLAPNDGQALQIANGGPNEDERNVLDAGFLELVRYGVLRPDDSAVLDSLPEIDDMGLAHDRRIKYTFPVGADTFVGWRRYSFDHYGERTEDDSNFREPHSHTQRGRVWPIFTGERGHFEMARKALDGSLDATDVSEVMSFVRSMEHFANDGLMLSEQVWDGVSDLGVLSDRFVMGEGTDSATPLAWSHAEYVKLVKSLNDAATWDANSTVASRYGGATVNVTFTCNNGQTIPGENVYVVGSTTYLGQWDTGSALKLEPTAYPIWDKTFTLPASTPFEWKCIKEASDGTVLQWGPDPNVSHTTPASGASATTGSL